MRPTRRGFAVAVIVCFALLQGIAFGERSLNYVAVPGLAAFAYGAFTLLNAEKPTVERSAVRPGFPGETRHETIVVDGSGVATVAEFSPGGIEADPIERTVSLPCELDRELRLGERGVYTLGPLTVRQRDPLGLLATATELEARNEVLVYPEIYELDRPRVIGELLGGERATEGQSFDRLREYQDGDPLTRIHWKSTAKYDELLTVESDPIHRTEPIHVAVDGPVTMADDLATAAGSLGFVLLDAGFEVSLTLPDAEVPDDRGRHHRENILGALASTGEGPGWVDDSDSTHLDRRTRDTADVLILGDDGTVTVRIGDETVPFDRLRPRSEPTASNRAAIEVSGG